MSTEDDTVEKVQDKFGGTWVAYSEGRTLIGVGNNGTSTYESNSIGGNEKSSISYTPKGTISSFTGNVGGTAITIDQMPSHTHDLSLWCFTGSSNGSGKIYYGLNWANSTGSLEGYGNNPNSETYGYANSIGGGKTYTHTMNHTHNFLGEDTLLEISNIQPYTVVYMYKRTA